MAVIFQSPSIFFPAQGNPTPPKTTSFWPLAVMRCYVSFSPSPSPSPRILIQVKLVSLSYPYGS